MVVLSGLIIGLVPNFFGGMIPNPRPKVNKTGY
jgi:hypothetical protein